MIINNFNNINTCILYIEIIFENLFILLNILFVKYGI